MGQIQPVEMDDVDLGILASQCLFINGSKWLIWEARLCGDIPGLEIIDETTKNLMTHSTQHSTSCISDAAIQQ